MPHTRFPHSWRVLAVSLLLAAVLLAHSATVRVQAATFTVTSTADAVDASPGDGVCATATGGCTVRAAVEEANAERSADTITVPAGRYRLILGQLSITTDMTISGAGADRTILDGNGSTRVIEVGGGVAAARIADVTIQNGNAGTDPLPWGGGILTSGGLTLTDVVLRDNTAQHGGGLAYGLPGGLLQLTNVTLSGNSATSDGGGLWTENRQRTLLTNVTISGNTAGSRGGGIANLHGSVVLDHGTVTGNRAAEGGGLYTSGGSPMGASAQISLAATIVAGNAAGGNCAGPLTAIVSRGSNLEDRDTCGLRAAGDLITTDPRLGPLADTGGSTPTHVPRPGSPAIDAGRPACPPPATDQRGVVRPQDGDGDGRAVCDIGAVELAATAIIEAFVSRVIDGDSLDAYVAGRRTAVGYLGVAAPAPTHPCGVEALARNRELAGTRVLLEEDPTYQFDARGRRLYYAYATDGTSIDETLVREGLAWAVRTDARYGAQLAALQAEAAAAGRGCLWDRAGGPSIPATVLRVIDGSTLEVRIADQRRAVAYLGATAPTTTQLCGAAALARNRELAGTHVLLEEDPAYSFDALGRHLYYAYTREGVSIDVTLIGEGLARAVRTDARHGAALTALEADARTAGRGCLWGGTGSP